MADDSDLEEWRKNTAFGRNRSPRASVNRPGEGRSPMMGSSNDDQSLRLYDATDQTPARRATADRPGEGRSPMMGRGSRGQFRGARPSEADRLMDIYNKQGGASDEDISSAYRSINPTMKKGGKVAAKKVAKKPMKISKPKAVKYARGGGIESRGKTRGKFV